MWRSVPAIICLERELRGCCAVSAKLFAEGCGPDPFQNTAHSTGSGSRDRKPSGPWIADKAQNWLVLSRQINVGGHCMKKAVRKTQRHLLGAATFYYKNGFEPLPRCHYRVIAAIAWGLRSTEKRGPHLHGLLCDFL